MPPLKVCIVGLKCYDHLAGTPVPRYLGGIETQLTILARGLAQQGCDVSMITYDHGQPDRQMFHGVQMFKSYRPEAGLPVLRQFHPFSTRLWRAMRQANAEVYLQMGAGCETGQTAFGCRKRLGRRRTFVFCAASDANFQEHLSAGILGWEGAVYRYGLRRADLIVSQTRRQQAGFEAVLGVQSCIIPMSVAPYVLASPRWVACNGSPRVLWVGRITPGKRLEWLLEAARRCPEIKFDVVGTPNKPSAYAEGLLAQAASLPNVKAHGRLPEAELRRLYGTARLLCCTSALEGFPTTFLEAWSGGIPVVTTFDPDGVVAQHQLGCVVPTLDDLVAALRDLFADSETYRRMSSAATAYYSEHHTVEAVCGRFRRAFERLLDNAGRNNHD